MAHLDKRPVIVMGDMNTLYHRDDVKKVFFDEIEASGLATAADAWVELQQSGVFPEMGGERQADELLDKVIYINPKDAATTIVPLSYEVDKEGYEVNGVALGDHYPVIVRFAIQTTKDTNGVKSVEKDAEDQEWYTLQGVRKDDQKKGIGINRRGKKVLF
jgi:exonuclease III